MGKSSVPSLGNRDELKQFEEKEDCFILEFDPDDELDMSKLSLSENVDADLHVVAEKGQVACRDYPHPRHACAKFPFRKTPHESHCELCYCYVCDIIAPCKKWVGKSNHCHAFDTDMWSIKRKLKREAVERKKEEYKEYPHPRYMCTEFPFEMTPHHKYCELCCCYVCESTAPCEKWVGTSNHCLAINNEKWRTKRELMRLGRELQAKQKEHVSGASITTTQQEESNPVLHEDLQQQEQQTFQANLVGSSDERESDELSDEAKLYVGNLPITVDSHDLTELFRKAGFVKKSYVVYNYRWSDGGQRFCFVTMGTVEEAEKAIEMFDGSCLDENVLTVRKAKRLPTYEATYSIYVGNLSHKVDDRRLETLFTEKGYKVVNARIVVDTLTKGGKVTKRPRGFGFVLMASEREREDAIKTLDGQIVDGREISLANTAY